MELGENSVITSIEFKSTTMGDYREDVLKTFRHDVPHNVKKRLITWVSYGGILIFHSTTGNYTVTTIKDLKMMLKIVVKERT